MSSHGARSPVTSDAVYTTLRSVHANGPATATSGSRSEEHTSELQSRRDLVCRLLLEKKKTAAHHRRKAQHFGVWIAVLRRSVDEPVDHLFLRGGARIDAVDVERPEQRHGDRIEISRR